MPDDVSPISLKQAQDLFADCERVPAMVLAVSGGPDSMALMWLAWRWRGALANGPRLIAATVDHGLRPEAAAEARQVKRLARALDLPHRTLRWTGAKPKTGLPAAARAARYGLLAQWARSCGATHVLTAHTRDDQAETLVMRLLRGSGIAGLAAMARVSERDGVTLMRPLLGVAKAQLLATLQEARLGFADDPTNHDANFTRPRIRALMPRLAAEGGDSRNLARLASRLARANAAVELMVDGAERYLALSDRAAALPTRSLDMAEPKGGFATTTFATKTFVILPEEIRLRLLMRTIDRFARESSVELGKVEALLAVLDQAAAENAAGGRTKLKKTLAGALISLDGDRIVVGPAPPRRQSGQISPKVVTRKA